MLEKGADLLKSPVEICCFAHAVNGGVRIDQNAGSTVPGLYAAGETAGGPHGADRLGGNMMVTCQVFGEIAGCSAAQYAMRRRSAAKTAEKQDPGPELLHKSLDTAACLDRLHACTQRYLLVNRTQAGLQTVLQTVRDLERELAGAPDTDAIHLENAALQSELFTAKVMAFAALQRKESRGSHHRADWPQKDEKQGTPLVIDRHTKLE